MEQQFYGVQLVYPCAKELSVTLANCQKVLTKTHMRTLQMTIGTPWGPVAIDVAFPVIQGLDSVLILGSKTLREKLGIGAMSLLEGKAQGGDAAIMGVPTVRQDGGSDSQGGVGMR